MYVVEGPPESSRREAYIHCLHSHLVKNRLHRIAWKSNFPHESHFRQKPKAKKTFTILYTMPRHMYEVSNHHSLTPAVARKERKELIKAERAHGKQSALDAVGRNFLSRGVLMSTTANEMRRFAAILQRGTDIPFLPLAHGKRC